MRFPVAVFHRSVDLTWSVARVRSGPNATDGTTWPEASARGALCFLVAVFQRSVRPSLSPVARIPPGPNATENTPCWLAGSERAAASAPVVVFQR